MEKDFSNENPGLRMLYVKWAVRHLTVIDAAIKKFHNQGNLNMLDMIVAMQEQRAKLLTENKAYADAQDILNEIRHAKGKKILVYSEHFPDPEKEKQKIH